MTDRVPFPTSANCAEVPASTKTAFSSYCSNADSNADLPECINACSDMEVASCYANVCGVPNTKAALEVYIEPYSDGWMTDSQFGSITASICSNKKTQYNMTSAQLNAAGCPTTDVE